MNLQSDRQPSLVARIVGEPLWGLSNRAAAEGRPYSAVE
jgi:hypothetical protein